MVSIRRLLGLALGRSGAATKDTLGVFEPDAQDTELASKTGSQHSALVIVIALVAVVVALAAVFATARSSVQNAEIGTRGIYDEAVLSAVATTRNRAVQAFLVLSATEAGIAEEADLAWSVEAAEAGIAELAVRVDRLTEQLTQTEQRELLLEASDDFAASVGGLLEQIGDGDPGSPTEADLLGIDDDYQVLAEFLASDRERVVSELELAQADAGRIANAASFLVAFAIPLVAVFAFRRSVRRRQHRIDLEQELARQREIAQNKDDFIADVSHELRTPLTSIYGFASTLLDKQISSDPELTAEFATLIAMEADELSRMVDDLLTAARADDDGLSFRREKVNPATEVAAVLAPMSAMGIEVISRVAPEPVSADRLRLRQVLRNLLSNAHKHGQAPIAVTGRVERLRYVLAVTDSGPGVPPELEDRLFQRFMHKGRDPLVTGSVGLGLSIARLLVRRMGGNLTYQRRDGMTTFLAELPLWVDLGEIGTSTEPAPSLSAEPGTR
ncbi:MAG: HAMP domain-containing sensor histidine kinase [Acidimicrobiia bacterium]